MNNDLSKEELRDLNAEEIESLLSDVSESLNTMRWILQVSEHDEDVWGKLRDARVLIGEARDKLNGFKQ